MSANCCKTSKNSMVVAGTTVLKLRVTMKRRWEMMSNVQQQLPRRFTFRPVSATCGKSFPSATLCCVGRKSLCSSVTCNQRIVHAHFSLAVQFLDPTWAKIESGLSQHRNRSWELCCWQRGLTSWLWQNLHKCFLFCNNPHTQKTLCDNLFIYQLQFNIISYNTGN